ncbi:MAG: polysaccharide pyruvyl transferase family protein [Methanobacterium sp.]
MHKPTLKSLESLESSEMRLSGEKSHSHKILKVLLVGYNGANNTGSEARLLSIIDDIRFVLGPDVELTVPTLNEKNLRRYIQEGNGLKIAPVPSIFFLAIDRLVKEHDLVILVEGSCYMDTWTSALLWAFLWATHSAHHHEIPCLAYAVDAGELSHLNQWLVKREASKTDLIITRTKYAAERLKKIGVTAPITSTADCAFNFQENSENHSFLKNYWPEARSGVVGMSVVDFSLWPVVIRPWGRSENLYKWPYYFARSKERKKARERLVEGWAKATNRIIDEHGQNVALICMEELDEPLGREIRQRIENKDMSYVISSGEFNASQMTSMLCELALLVTSRYHASVLSLRALVPQIVVGHDPRLTSLYLDLGLYDDYFISHDDPHLWEVLKDKVDLLLRYPNLQREQLEKGYQEQMSLAHENKNLLQKFLEQKDLVGK